MATAAVESIPARRSAHTELMSSKESINGVDADAWKTSPSYRREQRLFLQPSIIFTSTVTSTQTSFVFSQVVVKKTFTLVAAASLLCLPSGFAVC